MKLIGNLKKTVDTIDSKEGKREAIRIAGMMLTDDELEQVSGGIEDIGDVYVSGYFYVILENPYEKVGPFDTMGQAEAYAREIIGRPYEIIIEF